jgi:ABC-2 type transport system ATP-binding protein
MIKEAKIKPLNTVEIERLSKTYPKGKVLALEDVSVRLEAGKVTGLLGPNGSGKTTLARILVGLLKPTSGHVEIAGEIVTAKKRASLPIGYVPQRLPGFPGMTGKDLIEFVLVTQGYWGKRVKTACESAVEKLSLQDIQNKLIWNMSGGEARLTLIAAAIASRPALLVLDEPNTGLDPSNRRKFWTILESIKHEWSPTILLITHDIADAEYIIDNAVILRKGKIVREGEVGELRRAYSKQLKCRITKSEMPAGEGWCLVGPGQWKKIISHHESASMLTFLNCELEQGATEASLGAASLEDVVVKDIMLSEMES